LGAVSIALDAMGGDHGPSVVVPAALDALKAYPNLKLVLVGDKAEIQNELSKFNHTKTPRERLQIQEAKEMVEMDEPPAMALRKKRDSSMRVAIDLVKSGECGACVSAGNTGALMAIARFVLKTLPGIDRPAIVYSLPSLKGHVHVLDLGANVDCTAEHLFQFALMGSILATEVDNLPNPSVGLLNVGREAIKGSEPVKRAAELLTDMPDKINYIGFVEGDDIYKGTANVIVCDGFVGNVALKTSEGLIKMIVHMAKEEFKKHWYGKLAALAAAPVLKNLVKRLDPNRHNGASFLGLRGVVIKSHGNASIKAFSHAIQVAMIEAEKNIPDKIRLKIAERFGIVNHEV